MKHTNKVKGMIVLSLLLSGLAVVQGPDYSKDIKTNKLSLEKNTRPTYATFIYHGTEEDYRYGYWNAFDIKYQPHDKKFVINAKNYVAKEKIHDADKIKWDIVDISKKHSLVLSDKALQANPDIAQYGKTLLELAQLDMLSALEKPIKSINLVVMGQKSTFKGYKMDHTVTDYRYMIKYMDGSTKLSENVASRLDKKEFIVIPSYSAKLTY